MKFGKMLPALALCLIFLPGCGKGKPEGIPPLYPVTVTVNKSGTPVVGANVFFIASSGTASGSWSISGVTDAQGIAIMETSQGDWKAKGTPEGEFKIYMTKLGKIEEPEAPSDDNDKVALDEYYAERKKRLEAASKEIPKALTSASTSGLTISVAPKTGANETIDVDSKK